MLRLLSPYLFTALLFAGNFAQAQTMIWPETLGEFERTASKELTPNEPRIWKEYGLQYAEEAQYASPKVQFTSRFYQMRDSTGAMAAFEWQRPKGAAAPAFGELAVETGTGVTFVLGNYLLEFEGHKPSEEERDALLVRLPRFENAPLPVLRSYLPAEGLIPFSERYILGPDSLEKFLPRIVPSLAAFHYGTEVQTGRYQTSKGEMTLAVFSYPTPQIAQKQVEAFRAAEGFIAKRSGPLVAILFRPPDMDAAERLLASLRYEASITMPQYVPTERDNVGSLIWNIFKLIGILIVFCFTAGIGVALMRRYTKPSSGEAMIRLDIGK